MPVSPENNPAGIRPFGEMMGVYESTPSTVPDGQTAMPAIDQYRNLKIVEAKEAVYTENSFQATITSANATTATQVKAGTALKSIYVTDFVISTDTAMNIQLQDDAGTPVVLMEQIYLPANSVFSKSLKVPLKVATGKDLNVVASASGNISVLVTGYII